MPKYTGGKYLKFHNLNRTSQYARRKLLPAC